jgi:uncharacterized protein YqfA (UPF0365 family)
MREFLSTIFGLPQLASSEYVQLTTLLIALSLLGVIVWISVLASLTVRHIVIASLRISMRIRRQQILNAINKSLW